MDTTAYRISVWGEPDPRWRKCTAFAAVLGAITVVGVWVVPLRTVEITSIDQVPERLAKLILEEPAPPKAAPKPKADVRVEAPPEPKAVAAPAPAPAPVAKPKPAPVEQATQSTRRAAAPPKVAENRGQVGREQAQRQVREQLASVETQVSAVVADVTSSLAAASTASGAPRPSESARRRRTRAGREASQLASAAPAMPTAGPAGTSSRIEGTSIAIESIGFGAVGGGTGGGTAGGVAGGVPGSTGSRAGAGAPGERSQVRSDAQLLAVVRKYAPGIQFCYDNELKKSPGLGGKLVVSITVTSSGGVTDAKILQDSVRSPGLAQCALAKIETWKFPQVGEGVVTFQAPFVFTPPE
jgi:TonB family protein